MNNHDVNEMEERQFNPELMDIVNIQKSKADQDDLNAEEISNDYKILCENLKGHEQTLTGKVKSQWTSQEDQKLLALTENVQKKDWNLIASHFENKTSVQCFNRFSKVIKPNLTSNLWTIEEVSQLEELIKLYGPTKWTEISRKMKKRSRNECMNRWNFHISGSKYLRTIWLPTEELKLVLIVKKYGTYWCKIAKLFEDKDEYSTKNKFYSIMRRTANYCKKTKDPNRKIKIYNLKLKELMCFIDDAVTMLKEEQNLSDKYEENLNKIIESECSFAILGEKLDLINVDNSNEISDIEHSNFEAKSFNNDQVNVSVDNPLFNIKPKEPERENVIPQPSLKNELKFLPLTVVQSIPTDNINVNTNTDTLKALKCTKVSELEGEKKCNVVSCRQTSNQNKILLCKSCKEVLKENLKKKILLNFFERNSKSNINTSFGTPFNTLIGMINSDKDNLINKLETNMPYIPFTF